MPRLLLIMIAVLSAVAIAGCGEEEKSAGGGGSGGGSGESGTGYTVEIPEGWTDQTKTADGSAVKVDRIWAGKPKGDFATNIVVIRETPAGSPSLDQVMEAFKSQVEPLADDQGLGTVEETELDGEPARTYAYKMDKKEVRQRQVVSVKDDAVYTITFSAAAGEFEAEEASFDAFRDSWRWK